MPVKKLRDFLDQNGVKYVTISHSPAFSAQEVAASAHVSGKDLAKTVMVKLDGTLAMVVVPASRQVNFERLAGQVGAEHAELATEQEFRDLFPDCELGAMPPFGNLYGMKVYASGVLAEDRQIAFSAGSHSELVQLDYSDFTRLVEPRILPF